jgi:CRISPR system Cascade subunit CasE
MSLHLVQILPDPAKLALFAYRARLPEQDPGYILHRALRDAFGEKAPQPFRLFDAPGKPLRLLGYADCGKEELDAAKALVEPDLDAAFPSTTIDAKAMPPQFAAGTALGFEVRICPIVRTWHEERQRPREVDAFLHRVLALPPEERIERETVYREWLKAQLSKGGADLVEASMTSFKLDELARRTHASPTGRTETKEGSAQRLLSREKARSAARRPDAVFMGRLAVRDAGAFQTMLGKGVGRHRAFGYGMLLLRRA